MKAHGDWRFNPVNSAIYAKHATTIHLSYKVTSSVYAPTDAFLNAASTDSDTSAMQPYLATPPTVPAEIKVTADTIIANAHAVTPYQKAVALQAWFQAGTYDISIKTGTTENALLTFVRDRRGYCEQFAATMALMARLEGIPARVDIGFTPGTKIGTLARTSSPPPTRTPGRSCTSPAPAGCASSRRRGPTVKPRPPRTRTPRSAPQATSSASAAPDGAAAPERRPHPRRQPERGQRRPPRRGHEVDRLSHLPVGWLIAS